MKRIVALVLCGMCAIGSVMVPWQDLKVQAGTVTLYARERANCILVIPDNAIHEEVMAASQIADTLRKAASYRLRVPIVTESEACWDAREKIFVGETRAGNCLREAFPMECVRIKVAEGCILIQSQRREDVFSAAILFLERTVAARWFIPGECGEDIPRRDGITIPTRTIIDRPGYFSRDLDGIAGTGSGKNWYARNKLVARISHGHTMHNLVTAADVRADKRFLPKLENGTFIPTAGASINWQPNYLAEGLAEFVADKAKKHFKQRPHWMEFVVGQNDTYRYDQSANSLARISPIKYFRKRPSYSNIVFSFINAVAELVEKSNPGKIVVTYAYDNTEAVPDFKVRRNVIPFLTADRSGWFDPSFAAEDAELIKKWANAGPLFIGIYDYLYGAPFLVPRPTLWAVTDPIPFAFSSGARAYFAEMKPNWALDGPKPWLAAQLLWNPHANATELINEYYRRFFGQAGEVMRQFYETADRQWHGQEIPAVWLKFYRDDDQRRLFPPTVRREMDRLLGMAEGSAVDSSIRKRIQLTRAGFSVFDCFCEHDESRERLASALMRLASPGELTEKLKGYSRARARLLATFGLVKASTPLAISTDSLADYLRFDPRLPAIRALVGSGAECEISALDLVGTGCSKSDVLREIGGRGRELLNDAQWTTLKMEDQPEVFRTDWSLTGAWRAKSEPREGAEISILREAAEDVAVRYAACNQENLWQWNSAREGKLYMAQVEVRGRVSAGNMVYVLVPFIDAVGAHLDAGHTARLPAGSWPQWTKLTIIARAPPGTRGVAFSLRTLYQITTDWVEWRHPSLKLLE